jgi:uncharacterized Tic20 family protein
MSSEQPEPYTPTQDERTLACISHLTVFVSSFGLLIAIGLWIYLQTRKTYPFAAFQAGQAVLFQLIVMVLTFIVIGFVMIFMFGAFGLSLAAGSAGSEAAFGIVLVISVLVFMAIIVLLTLGFYGYAVYAAIRSYQARPFRIPAISALADLISPMPNVKSEYQI